MDDPLLSVKDDPLLSVKEAGTYLGGVSRWTMARLVDEGKLEVVWIRRRKMFRLSALDRHIRDNRRSRAA